MMEWSGAGAEGGIWIPCRKTFNGGEAKDDPSNADEDEWSTAWDEKDNMLLDLLIEACLTDH